MVHNWEYEKEEVVDKGLRNILIPATKEKTLRKDDDFLLLVCGSTGSGKSTIAFHIYELYHPTPTIEYVALSRHAFAQALKNVSEHKPPRFLNYDEADMIKRDAISRWNKSLVRLYAKIRGKNIFHVWCHPSPEMIDKHQIEEVVGGMIYVYYKGKPRRYLYFTKKGLLKVLEKHGNLKEKSLLASKNMARWRGWFKQYNGPLWKDYLNLKKGSIVESIEEFYEEWGKGPKMSGPEISHRFGMSIDTVYRRARKLGVPRTAGGQWMFTEEWVKKIVGEPSA